MTILTSPPLSPDCAAGKVAWLKRFFGKGFREFVITPRKALLAKPGTILIDDTERHVEEFRAAGGDAILFPQPWNANRDRANRLGFVAAELTRWASRDTGLA